MATLQSIPGRKSTTHSTKKRPNRAEFINKGNSTYRLLRRCTTALFSPRSKLNKITKTTTSTKAKYIKDTKSFNLQSTHRGSKRNKSNHVKRHAERGTKSHHFIPNLQGEAAHRMDKYKVEDVAHDSRILENHKNTGHNTQLCLG